MRYSHFLLALLFGILVVGHYRGCADEKTDFINDAGTVLLLKMNEGQGEPQDSSENGNHAKHPWKTVVPEWTTGRFERNGHALDFGKDGAIKFLQIPSSPSLNKFEQITLEAWIYPHKPQREGWILTKGHTGIPPSYGLYITADGDMILDLKEIGRIKAPRAIEFERWQHVAGTYDGGYLRLFVDGKMKEATIAKKGVSIEENASPLFIGMYGGTGAPYAYDGLIEQIRISRIARYTPAKVRIMPAAYMTAVKTDSKPVIDGKLDDKCWQNSVEAGNFTRTENHQPATAQTKVYVLYDNTNLYFGFRCEEPLLDPVLNMLHAFKAVITKPDDNVWADDSVEIFLTTSEGAMDYYHIAANSLGTTYTAHGSDKTWSPATKTAGGRTDSEWSVEMAIPFTSMGLTSSPKEETLWRMNLCRTRRPDEKELYTSWSPVGVEGFHSPASFGYLSFTGSPIPSLRDMDFGLVKQGDNSVSARMKYSSNESVEAALRLIAVYENEQIVYTETDNIPAQSESVLKLDYPVDTENRCLRFEPTNAGTVSAHTSEMSIKPDTNYHFSAMVKVEESTFPAAYQLFSIQGKDINYERVGVVDTTEREWQNVRGTWKSPGTQADVRLWLVGWKGHGKGVFLVDDIKLIEEGSNKNLVPNSTFPPGSEFAGWPTVMNSRAADSYGAGIRIFKYTAQVVSGDKIVYQSPVFSHAIEKKIGSINSYLVHMSTGQVVETYNLTELYIVAGTIERVNLLLKSPVPDTIKEVFFEIEIPAFVKLVVEDFAYSDYISPLDWKEETFDEDGIPFRRYVLRFNRDAISDYKGYMHEILPVPLIFQAVKEPADYGRHYAIHFRAWMDEKEKEPVQQLSLKILPPMYGRKPKKLPLIIWGPSTDSIKKHSMAVQKMLVYQWSSVFNTITSKGEALDSFSEERGMYPFALLPTITLPWEFPSAKQYLEKHPEYRDRNANGKEINSICFAHLLEDKSMYLKEMKEIITRWVSAFPHHVNWDYEFGVTQSASPGFSERNIKLFQQRSGIETGRILEIKEILNKYRSEWVDFRCKQNAEFAVLYRQYVKDANPNTLYSMYSGYPPASAETYGVDWKYMSKHVDLAMCGYGRGNPGLVYDEIGGRYWNAGELVWGGWYNLDNFQNIIFQRLTDAGSFMVYLDWIIDGRFLYGVSRAAAVAADFEEFFMNIKREDKLVTGTDGKPMSDAAVMTYNGERLIFIFNTSPAVRELTLVNVSLPMGMLAVDWETGNIMNGHDQIRASVPARGVQVIYIAGANKIKAEFLKSARRGTNLILTHPGDMATEEKTRTGLDSKEKLGYWTELISTFSKISKDYTVKRNGLYSYKMTMPLFDTGSPNYVQATTYRNSPTGTRLPRVEAGQKWQFSIWARTEGDVGAGAEIRFVNSQGKILQGASQTLRNASDWQEISVIATVPKEAVNLILGMRTSTDGSGNVWFDDPSLNKL